MNGMLFPSLETTTACVARVGHDEQFSHLNFVHRGLIQIMRWTWLNDN